MNWSEKSSRNLNFLLRLAMSSALMPDMAVLLRTAGSGIELKPDLVRMFSSW